MSADYLQLLGYVSAAMTVVALFTVKRWPVMWLVYSAASVLYTILMLLTGIWGWAFAGLIFIIIGIFNYAKE